MNCRWKSPLFLDILEPCQNYTNQQTAKESGQRSPTKPAQNTIGEQHLQPKRCRCLFWRRKRTGKPTQNGSIPVLEKDRKLLVPERKAAALWQGVAIAGSNAPCHIGISGDLKIDIQEEEQLIQPREKECVVFLAGSLHLLNNQVKLSAEQHSFCQSADQLMQAVSHLFYLTAAVWLDAVKRGNGAIRAK